MMFKLDLRATIAAAALALGAAGANAVTLTFEELPHQDELQGVGDVVQSKGYVLRYEPAPGEPNPVGFHSVGPSWRFNGRSTALLANSCSAVTTLTAKDSLPLTLVSIDLDESNGDDHADVTFKGVTVDGTVVTHAVQLNGLRRWETIKFPPTFSTLQYVTWEQGDCIINPPHMFDNLRVHPTYREAKAR